MNLFDLKEKTALITGASSGLGERFAQILAQAGAKVILTARRFDKLKELAGEIQRNSGQAIPLEMDVTDKTAVKGVLDSLTAQGEKIDILINNAGIAKLTPVFDLDEANDFESLMKTNVMGVWYAIKQVATHMKNHQIEGSIINISSVYGLNKLESQQTAYCASKAAVIQMTKALVGELSAYNIRINCITPGYILTPMVPSWVSKLNIEGKIEALIPQKYLANPSDLDGTLLYLASNKASRYVTGSCITVDGGLSWGGV